MAQKPKIGRKFHPTNADPGYITPRAITGQRIELESRSNPLKTREVLQFAIKNILDLDVGFSVNVYMITGCLCIFCLHLDDVIIPWEPTKRANFVAQSFFYILSQWFPNLCEPLPKSR